RRRRARRSGRDAAGGARRRLARVADPRAGPGGDTRSPRRAARSGTPARSHAADRSVRGRLRREARGTHPRRARGEPPRHRPGPARATHPRGAAHASGKIELAPEPIAGDVERLRAALARPDGQLMLIGRRDLRSNNSWMHNLRVLVKGNPRCTAQINPADAARLAIADGELARVTSRAGAIELPVEVTDAIMPGVVSIP